MTVQSIMVGSTKASTVNRLKNPLPVKRLVLRWIKPVFRASASHSSFLNHMSSSWPTCSYVISIDDCFKTDLLSRRVKFGALYKII
jgi:hypothetical protein